MLKGTLWSKLDTVLHVPKVHFVGVAGCMIMYTSKHIHQYNCTDTRFGAYYT